MASNNELNEAKWDFFIAHAHKDKNTAREVYECIVKKGHTVFLDQASINPGSYWDQEIPKAQQESKITIALISGNMREAYYARDELHTGINLARARPNHHKIIPVYLNGILENSNDIIYGIRLLQGLDLTSIGSIENLAILLCDTAQQFKSEGEKVFSSNKETEHELLSYPTGPLVEREMIPRVIIEIYSTFIRESEAKLVIAEANSFRQEANSGTKFIIPFHKVPPPDKIPAFNFWLDVFDYARLQGPRMLAALLLVVPDDQFDVKAKSARMKLLEALKNHS